MDAMQDYRDQLVRRLEQSAISPPEPGLRALAWALVDRPLPDPLACAWIQEALPEYVEAEIHSDLELSSGEQAAVHRHLLLCAECSRLYIRLLQIAWLLARDALPRPSHRPAPRLPFGGRFA